MVKATKCPSTDKSINKIRYTHTMEYLHLKKEGDSDICKYID